MAPTSTYRVQIRPGFGFKDTAELADYLADLGVSHLYTAPILAAVPGSEHGYDVVDHTRVNPALGGEEGRLALRSATSSPTMRASPSRPPTRPGGTCSSAAGSRSSRASTTSTGSADGC
jgi:hypothetical protein